MTKKKVREPDKPLQIEITTSDVERFSGSVSQDFQKELLDQVTNALWLPGWKTEDQKVQATKAAIQVMQNIAPRSELRGMLAAQMPSTHNAAMEYLRR